MSQYKVIAATGQHVGDRTTQQDRIAILATPKAPGYMMTVLAHGLGGGADGALAAEQVIHTAKQLFEHFSPSLDNIESMLQAIGHEAHQVLQLSSFSSKKHPQCSMVVMVITPQQSAVWAHVGDARLYRFTGPNFAERTHDHSEDDGPASVSISFRRLDEKPQRRSGILLNVIGTGSNDLFVTVNRNDELKEGDAFILCSPGFWEYFDDTELGAAIAMNTPREASEMLIRKARERAAGSEADNCSLAIVKLVAAPKEVKKYTIGNGRKSVADTR
jgi:serine/threonine protein phosphatase PrpC